MDCISLLSFSAFCEGGYDGNVSKMRYEEFPLEEIIAALLPGHWEVTNGQ